MRFALAIASLVVAGILLILGIGQRTFLAGPSEIVYSADLPASANFAIISGDQFDAVPGQSNIVVTGPEGFAAVGSTTDVEAWIAPLEHAELVADPEEQTLRGSLVPAQSDDVEQDSQEEESSSAGEEDESEEDGPALDPRGSDLWLVEQDGAGRMPISLVEDQSVLVQAPSGSKVSVAWVQDVRTPLAGPLLVAGGLFAILGLVLYLLAVDHDRRGLGPRRGRKGPLPGLRRWLGEPRKARGSKSSAGDDARGSSTERRIVRPLALPVVGLATVLVLSGCSASYWPDFSPPKESETPVEETVPTTVAPVPLTPAQIDRIVVDVATVAGEADDARDPEILASRFANDALAQRRANYTIRSAVSDYEVSLPRITEDHLDYDLVQSTEGWPRTLFVTVASEAPGAQSSEDDSSDTEGENEGSEVDAPPASPSLAMMLTQTGPHENYRVGRIFALRGGISMPPAAPVEEGTARLADNAQNLVLPPGEVGTAYAAILTGDTESEQAALFDVEGDTVIAKSGAAWVATAKQSASDAGTDVEYSVSAAQSDTPIVSLSTGVGGALVATTVLESRVEEQTGDYQPTAVGAFAALSGLSGRHERLVSVVAHQLLFFVPSATSGDKIQLLGYTTELVEATN